MYVNMFVWRITRYLAMQKFMEYECSWTLPAEVLKQTHILKLKSIKYTCVCVKLWSFDVGTTYKLILY